MQVSLENAELVLRQDRPLRLEAARGTAIHCLDGVAWLTVAGDFEDYVLQAGQTHRLASDGLALVEAIGEARIRLEEGRG